jgi:beta-lactamase superfamily II metal-dependent hydrolase
MKSKKTTFVSALLVVLLAALGFFAAEGEGAQVVFLDVGQGDATFIRAPEGQTALIDGGRGQAHLEGLLEELGMIPGESLDVMIASHADFDHIGGLVGAAQTFPPRNFMDNSVPHGTQAYANLLEAVDAAGSRLLEPTRRRINLGSVHLEILPPPLTSDEQNDNSIGVVVHHGTFTVFIAGDATEDTQNYWRETYPDAFTSIEVYRSAHHGSDTGDQTTFVQFIAPEVVIVSVGEGNSYGHPTPAAMASYRSVTSSILRTDEVGHVAVATAGSGHFGYEVATGVLEATPSVDVVALLTGLLETFGL